MIEGGWSLPDVSEDYVLGLLHGHLRHSHDACAMRKPRFSLTTGGVETNLRLIRGLMKLPLCALTILFAVLVVHQ